MTIDWQGYHNVTAIYLPIKSDHFHFFKLILAKTKLLLDYSLQIQNKQTNLLLFKK